jgi:HTH-type transcriptional regulator/antitoxin MqsA
MASRRSCNACGSKQSMIRFEKEQFTIEHSGLRKAVADLSGWRCKTCDEVVFDPESAQRYANGGDELILQARKREQRELKRIRQKLDLTQQAAAEITGGGHNAFSRYERGTTQPLPAVVNLFKLLDRHPELLREILPGRARKRGRVGQPTAKLVPGNRPKGSRAAGALKDPL